MKGIEKLSLTPDQKKLIEASEQQYKRYARVYFEVVSFTGSELIVKVWQMENPGGKYLTAKELIERAKEVFSVVPVKVHCRPVPFSPDSLKSFTVQDVIRKMDEHGLKPKDLVRLLDIDKSSLSLILSGGRELSKGNRAMFYYLFKYLEK